MKSKQAWFEAGVAGASALFNLFRKNAFSVLQIQSAIAYLKGVEIVRDILFYQLGLMLCVSFLVFGVILIQGAAIFFISMEPLTRAMVALVLGFLDSGIALGVLIYFMSSKRWLRQAAKYNSTVENIWEEEDSRLHPNSHHKKRFNH